jgi:hypothetical protein
MVESDLIGATIVIPGFHPGHENYADGGSVFCHLFNAINMVFILSLHILLEEIVKNEGAIRDELCANTL